MVNETEWSALLFFSAKGHPVNPEGFVCTLYDIYLQDIGTPGYTAFKNDPETMLNLFDKRDDLLGHRMGIIHSHHSMRTFYSGTDMSELRDNSNGIDFYLSVVVNNRPEWIARVVYEVEEKIQEAETTVSWREDDEVKSVSTKSEPKTRTVLKYIDLEVHIAVADPELAERVKELRNKNAVTLREKTAERNLLQQKPKVSSPMEEDFMKWRNERFALAPGWKFESKCLSV